MLKNSKAIIYFKLLLLISILPQCAPKQIIPLTNSNNNFGRTKEESTIINQSQEYIDELFRKGLIYKDLELSAYIDSIASKVIPDNLYNIKHINIYILKDPSINAFALPDGSILIHLGLISKLNNEAQLAFAISHETAHIVQRHMMKNYIQSKRKVVTAKFTELFLTPIDVFTLGLTSSVVYLSAISSINGYGRELEKEADILGYKLYSKGGYPTNEAINLFDHLNEVSNMGGLEFFIYSSHPSNVQRKKSIMEISKYDSTAHDFVDLEYSKKIKNIQLYNVELRMQRKHYQYALKDVNNLLGKTSNFTDQEIDNLILLKADIYQSMAANINDVAFESALIDGEHYSERSIEKLKPKITQYQDSASMFYQGLLNKKSFVFKANRGMGLIAYDRGNYEDAKKYFEKYLETQDIIEDRRYIIHLINQIITKTNED